MRAAYRAVDAPESVSRDAAIERAAAFARSSGISRAAFRRAVERVDAVRDAAIDTTTDTTRDSLTGLPIVASGERSGDAAAAPAKLPLHNVHYRLATGRASIEVGDRGCEGDLRPIRRRRSLVALLFALGAGATYFAAAAYRSRHAWFEDHGATRALVLGGLVAACSLAALLAETLLGRRALRGYRLALFGVLAVASGAIATYEVSVHVPTEAHALALLRSGDDGGAFAEADAVDATHGSTGHSTVDTLTLERIPPLSDLEALAAFMHRPWRTQQARDTLRNRYRAAALRRANEAIANRRERDLEDLADEVAEWLPRERLQWQGRADLLAVDTICFNGGAPNAMCFRRQAWRAGQAGVPAEDLAWEQHHFAERAVEWARNALDDRGVETASIRHSQLELVDEWISPIESLLHEHLDLDLAAIRAERDRLSDPQQAAAWEAAHAARATLPLQSGP